MQAPMCPQDSIAIELPCYESGVSSNDFRQIACNAAIKHVTGKPLQTLCAGYTASNNVDCQLSGRHSIILQLNAVVKNRNVRSSGELNNQTMDSFMNE